MFKMEKQQKMINLIIGLFFFLSIAIIYLIPNTYSAWLRPVFIVLVFVFYIIRLKKFQFLKFDYFLILILFYEIIEYLRFTDVSLTTFLARISYVVIAIMLSFMPFEKKQVQFFISVIFVSCLFFSIGIIVSNPLLGSNRGTLNYFFESLNPNGLAAIIMPGIIIAYSKILYGKKSNIKYYTISVIIMSVSVMYSGSRQAFLLLAVISGIFIFYIIKNSFKGKNIVKILLIMSSLIVIVIILLNVLPESYILRVINFSEYSLNGRDDLQELAIQEAGDLCFFGKGYNAWYELTGSTYGTHNLYVDLYLSIGYVGAILYGLFIILLLYYCRNNILLAFILIPLFNSMFESGDGTAYWISVYIIIMIVKFCKRKNIQAKELFKYKKME